MAQSLINNGINPGNSKVLVMGLSFKENVADIRNSRTIDLVHELQKYSIEIQSVDPGVESFADTTIHYTALSEITDQYDAIVLAVSHAAFRDLPFDWFVERSVKVAMIFDVKNLYSDFRDRKNLKYWSL